MLLFIEPTKQEACTIAGLASCFYYNDYQSFPKYLHYNITCRNPFFNQESY